MFIDIHTHAYRLTPPMYRFCTPEQLLKRYDEMKVDAAVILPVVSPEIYFPQAVEDVLEMRGQVRRLLQRRPPEHVQLALLAARRHTCAL